MVEGSFQGQVAVGSQAQQKHLHAKISAEHAISKVEILSRRQFSRLSGNKPGRKVFYVEGEQ
jgi:hypothetical protein